jgi:hypothetical protein
MLEEVGNSNWGNAKEFSSAKLIAIASGLTDGSGRPSDFFLFVPPKPEDQRFPKYDKNGHLIGWLATPEESRSSRLADVVALNLWAQVSPGSEEDLFSTTPNAGVCLWVEVEWGSGGTAMTARVDVGRGTQIVIPADSIVCRLGCIALPNLGNKEQFPWVPLPIQMNAMVGRWAGSPAWRAKKTEFVLSLAATDVTYVRVPSFAWGLRVAGLRSVLNGAAIEIAAVTNDSGTEQVLDTWPALLLKDGAEYVPIPNGTEYVRVTNGTSLTLALMALEFSLSL